jgi:hypothetical protein
VLIIGLVSDVVIYIFHLSDEPVEDVASDEVNDEHGAADTLISSYQRWSLPSRDFDGLWERYDAHCTHGLEG